MQDVTSIELSNGTRVDVGPSWCCTTLPCGDKVHAHPTGSAFEGAVADRLGYGQDIAAMTRDHDLVHSLLANWLGLPASISLSQALGLPADPSLAALEEAAVIAIQKFARAAGVDLLVDGRL